MMNWSEYEEEHAQETRSHWPRLFWHIACCACLGVILALAVREARAEPQRLVYRDDHTTIRLLDDACSNEAAKAQIVELVETAGEYRSAVVEWKGTKYEGCHKIFKDEGAVCIVVDGLGHGDLPLTGFKLDLDV